MTWLVDLYFRFFVLSLLLKGRAEDQTKTITPSRSLRRSTKSAMSIGPAPLTSLPLSTGSQWKVYPMQSIFRKRHLLSFNARPCHGLGTLHISLSQPYHSPGATLFHGPAVGQPMRFFPSFVTRNPRGGRSLTWLAESCPRIVSPASIKSSSSKPK